MRGQFDGLLGRMPPTYPDQIQRWLRAWAPDLLAGLLVIAAAWVDWHHSLRYLADGGSMLIATAGMVLAVVLTRHRPALALATLWALGVLQFFGGSQFMPVQLFVVYVAFGVARWGQASTVWASFLSIPAASLGGLVFLETFGSGSLYQVADQLPVVVGDWAVRVGWQLIAVFVVMFVLLVPWLIGLAVRFGVRASASEASRQIAEASRQIAEADAARAQRESEQAREIAALREEQARLAADVHDVVGHSLAVILAQAESGQFLEPDRLPGTLATIATSARSSLQDIRQVLAGHRESGMAPPPGSFEELVEGVRTAGHEVVTSDIGSSRPLPPDLEVVAHRVVQEMLTNAMKHGRRDRPVFVERTWPEGPRAHELRIEVRNIAGSRTAETKPIRLDDRNDVNDDGGEQNGQGLDGMRRRLEAVGGRLGVRQQDEPDGSTFTVTAWVPVSGR